MIDQAPTQHSKAQIETPEEAIGQNIEFLENTLNKTKDILAQEIDNNV